MERRRAAITGVQGYVPDYVLTNKELEGMVDTNDAWITERTGIKERRILKEPGKATSDMCVAAVKGLLDKTNTRAEEIELVIVATVTADYNFPDTANITCDKAGLKNAYGFDVNAACSGFLFALITASQFIENGTHKKIIVIGADKMSSIIDYEDRTTCIIFGDGAGAVMLEPAKDDNGIVDSILRGDGAGREFLHQKAGGSMNPATAETVAAREHFVYQNGRPVFKAAVQRMTQVIQQIMQRNDLTNTNMDWLVPHQANIRIIESVAKMADFPLEKVMINIHKYGNTTAATIPLCLWEWESKLRKGDKLILSAFGGGFTWGAIYLRWAYDSH